MQRESGKAESGGLVPGDNAWYQCTYQLKQLLATKRNILLDLSRICGNIDIVRSYMEIHNILIPIVFVFRRLKKSNQSVQIFLSRKSTHISCEGGQRLSFYPLPSIFFASMMFDLIHGAISCFIRFCN